MDDPAISSTAISGAEDPSAEPDAEPDTEAWDRQLWTILTRGLEDVFPIKYPFEYGEYGHFRYFRASILN